ncbi:PAS-domain containing protein [Anderseniella sp. Alg231-50]|uniref:PAS-domain containing protein n=1 Tax=Anderseniella sp. Alg231-50 TaxID=1922226 RepID=UPI000D555DB4
MKSKTSNSGAAPEPANSDGQKMQDREMLDAVDAGVAIFDPDLNLVSFNQKYKDLCGYHDRELHEGRNLRELIRISMSGQSLEHDEIEQAIKTSTSRLLQGKQKFNFRTRNGNTITISRNPRPDGSVVETVHNLHLELGNTDVSALEQIARLAHARMMLALDAIGDGFVVYDANDCLTVYNQQFVELNPHISDLIKPGAHYATMLRTGISRGGLQGDGQSEEEIFEQEMERHRNPGVPYERQLEDGRWIRIMEKATEDGGTAGIRTDITELKNRELEVANISSELTATSSHLDTALNNMVQGLCMFDSEQRLILCNRQYLEMYGFSPEKVKPGMLLSDIMKYSISLGNYRDEDAEMALKARDNPSRLAHRSTIKQYLRDGRVMAVMNQPMTGGGSIATYQDITQLERHEERLRAYNDKLARSNKELQEFAYVASHDLQEPLRKIEAFGDRLVKKHGESLPDEGKVFVERMQNASFRMRELINDLLGYSRVTTNAKPFEKVSLCEVIEGVRSDLQIQLQESGGTIEFGELPALDADPIQMRQLFQNLISNALKFRKPDLDPVIRVSAEEHSVKSNAKGKVRYWRIKLADNGIGFDNQYKDQIFTIFQRLHGRLEYGGTGIGLATCRKIVERHNGVIDADGTPDVGATFIIDLPVEQEKSEDLQ